MEENLTPPSETPPAPLRPPPVLPPPPPLAAAQRPAPGGGRGWRILALFLLVLVCFMGAGYLKRAARAFSGTTRVTHQRLPALQEVTIEDNHSANKIAVIDVQGIIMGDASDRGSMGLVQSIEEQLKTAADDTHVKAVILKVNSPGGEVLASDDIYNLIVDFQQDSKKPVIASMQSLAASGGYYISAPCRWIVANEMTITGSIGVIMHGYNYRGLMDKIGLRPEVFKSGKFKDMLSGEKSPEEIMPEEKEMVQNLIMETYGKFTNIVAEGRGRAADANGGEGKRLDSDWADYADGRILSGNQAYEHGFVDELGNFKVAVERALKLGGVAEADLIQYQQPFDLSNLFHLFGKSEGKSIKVDLGMDFPKLHAGYLYFITPTALH
jgi:protease-4